MGATFFASPEEFHHWLATHHDRAAELIVGFHKKGSGRGGITYPQALDEALCFGWIDGVRRRLDDERYTIRFSPRTPRSIWSMLNIKRATELRESGRMRLPGLTALEGRDESRAQQYSYERGDAAFETAMEQRFRSSGKAWAFFEVQAPSYRRLATFWVMSAKREETRMRRLDRLIEDSAAGRRSGVVEPGRASQ